MDSPRFDRVRRTGNDALAASTTAVTSITSHLAKQAGPAAQTVAKAVREHGPPAYRRARQLFGTAAATVLARGQQALQSAQDGREIRAAAPKPSRAARRTWIAQLEELGHREVEDMLERTSSPHAGPQDVVRFVDAGITQGKTRYPTRQFVLDWLGGDEEPADIGLWRVSALVVICFALLSFGMLAVFV